jgi:hypothetical protein
VPSSNACESCHGTTTWLNARFDHAAVTGSCGSCHNGGTATGKTTNHFVTSLDCGECHRTTSWLPIQFTHSSPGYPGDHGGRLGCISCHRGNSQTATWTFPAYQPDCAGCHANDYERGPHRKVSSPAIYYTVGELRDCSGACHRYTDSSLTTIERRRSGEHRVTSGNWD